jgi:hypothetical protein
MAVLTKILNLCTQEQKFRDMLHVSTVSCQECHIYTEGMFWIQKAVLVQNYNTDSSLPFSPNRCHLSFARKNHMPLLTAVLAFPSHVTNHMTLLTAVLAFPSHVTNQIMFFKETCKMAECELA